MKRRLSLVSRPGRACAAAGRRLRSASPPVAPGPPATADGLAIQVVGPDQALARRDERGERSAGRRRPRRRRSRTRPTARSSRPTSTSVNATARARSDGTASVTTSVSRLSLFLGEITADAVAGFGQLGRDGRRPRRLDSDEPGRARRARRPAAPNARIPLADWGYAMLLAESTKKGAARHRRRGGARSPALVVHLDADHGGLPAGSEIRVGYADAYARPPAAPATTTTTTAATTDDERRRERRARPPRSRRCRRPAFVAGRRRAARRRPRRSAKTRRAARPHAADRDAEADRGRLRLPGLRPVGLRRHVRRAARRRLRRLAPRRRHLRAPRARRSSRSPSGTVFSVGWNEVGGWRLWLRDRAGTSSTTPTSPPTRAWRSTAAT